MKAMFKLCFWFIQQLFNITVLETDAVQPITKLTSSSFFIQSMSEYLKPDIEYSIDK